MLPVGHPVSTVSIAPERQHGNKSTDRSYHHRGSVCQQQHDITIIILGATQEYQRHYTSHQQQCEAEREKELHRDEESR